MNTFETNKMYNKRKKYQSFNFKGKRIIVTGATGGLGSELVEQLCMMGAKVIMAVRDVESGEQLKRKLETIYEGAQLIVKKLDLADLSSIQHFSEWYCATYDRLDVLVNNAGVMNTPKQSTKDGFELQFGVNHLGHFALTNALLDLILSTEGSRVVTVSSVSHHLGKLMLEDWNWEKRKYDPWTAYGDSKLANLLFAYELDRKFKLLGSNSLSIAVHPGWVNTNLGRTSGKLFQRLDRIGGRSKMQGILPYLRAISDPELKGGEYIGARWIIIGKPVIVRSSQRSYNKEKADQLWKLSEKITGLNDL